jgi:hypothetical protein
MIKIHRRASAIVALLILTFSGYVMGRAAEPPAADPPAREIEPAPSPAAEPEPVEEKPTGERLEDDFRAWLEAGEHLPLVDARKLSMLELLDLENAEFTWLTDLKLRVNCEIKAELEVPAAERIKTREQLQVLIADPQAGFLKQTLPNFTYFSAHAMEGRQHMSTVMALVEVLIGPKVVATPHQMPVTPTRPQVAPGRQGSVEREGGIQPTPAGEGIELGACCGGWVSACDPCSVIVSCCAPSRGCGWLPRRRLSWGWCAAPQPVLYGGCCAPVVPLRLSSAEQTRTLRLDASQQAASPVLIAQADVLRVLTEGGASSALQFVSITARAQPVSPQELAIADSLFRLGCQAYWSGQYPRALEKLGMAADLNAADARIWYFTGFAQSALGQREAATASLARAVQLHAKQPRDRSILESLHRVQGLQRDELQRALMLVPSVRSSAPPAPAPKAPASDAPLIARSR